MSRALPKGWPTPEMAAAFKLHFAEGSIWTDRFTRGLEAALQAAPVDLRAALAAQQPADELQALRDRLTVAETALAVYQRDEAARLAAAPAVPAAIQISERADSDIRTHQPAAITPEQIESLIAPYVEPDEQGAYCINHGDMRQFARELLALAQQPAASGEQAAQRDVRQADERGDEAMRRAHAAEDVLDLLVAFQAEYGRNAMDPDGMPGNEVYRPALQAIVNLAKATLGDSAGSSKAMSTVKAWIDSAALADAMDGAPR